jgi:3-methyl-2-oxobutanoate hydroxymethyltransferase
LGIPTIGIGAGPNCDGQVLVLQDMLGLSTMVKPRFVREYLDGGRLVREAVNQFCSDVEEGSFPSEAESYR